MCKYNGTTFDAKECFVMPFLFAPLTLGELQLRNRNALPPLTRCRSEQPDNIPGEMMEEYYRQRCSGAGFMITEGRQIEPCGQGYAWTPAKCAA